jgi:hypothetical protein
MASMRRVLAALACLIVSAPAGAMTGNAPSALGGRHAVMIVGSHGTFCTGDAAHQPRLLDVRNVARHPQFHLQALLAHRATADVALLKMAYPLPETIVPAMLGNRGVTPRVGDTLTVFGYGLAVRGDSKTGGTLRAARLSVTGHPGNLQIRLVDPATKGRRAGMGACTGDSGAPVFEGTALIGVVSWSTGPNMAAGCGGLTGVTPLSLYRAWIIATARKFGSPLAP